jgi:hypothetical protein
VCQQLPLELDDIFRAVDESELEIERIVFREMSAAGVRLGAIDMTRLEDPLERGDAVLLVELRDSAPDRRCVSKYWIANRLLPPSVPDATILEVMISWKCRLSRYSRKYLRIAAWILKDISRLRHFGRRADDIASLASGPTAASLAARS